MSRTNVNKIIICVLAICLHYRIAAQAISGQVMRLQPTTLPTKCNNGDLRVDQNTSNLLNICGTNAWTPISPGIGGANIALSNLSATAVNANILPNANNAFSLGNSTLSWSSVYGVNFFGIFNGTASFATTASSAGTAAFAAVVGTASFAVASGTASAATAFTATPTACGVGVWANAIGPNGNLTCAIVSTASTSGTAFFSATSGTASFATSSSTASTSGTAAFAAVSGTASAATAFTATPTACSSNQYALGISPAGNLTCAQVGFAQVTSFATIAQGGTNNATLAVTNGGVLYTDGSKAMNSGVGTASNVLVSNGSAAPTWAADTNFVGLIATNTAGSTVSNATATTMPFATVILDTNSAFDGAATYTCPTTAKYLVTANFLFSGQLYGVGNVIYPSTFRNGTAVANGYYEYTQSAITYSPSTFISNILICTAGSTLTVKLTNNRTGGTSTLDTAVGFNRLEISRLGL